MAPVPGRGVTSAAATLRTLYGMAACAWSVEGVVVTLAVAVPANASATVVRPDLPEDMERPLVIAAGRHEWRYTVDAAVAARWSDAPAPA